MADDENLERLREIHRIVCELVAVPKNQRADVIEERCKHDAKLNSAVLKRLELIELEETSRDLGADFSQSYELLGLLGRGGMGEVYRAVQTKLGREVAVKKVRQGNGSNSASTAFLREARLAASIKHPGIVPVYDVGTLNGQPCFAMELVEGKSLDEVIGDQVATSDTNAVEIVADLSDALSEAHRRGIIHRDLKPGNVLLDSQGRPRISDFGIARLIGADDRPAPHSVAGSIGYIAPEQALGEPIDQTADLFSLGAILFALLTGKPPYVDSSTNTIEAFAQSARNSTTPLIRSRNARVDRKLAAICHRCLNAEPSNRYRSAEQLATDLRGWLRWRKLKIPVFLASIAFLIVLVIGGFFVTRSLRQDAKAARMKADVDYATGMETAYQAWQDGEIEKARALLTRVAPEQGDTDRRGIEWDYLWYETHRESHVFGEHTLYQGGLDLSPDGTLMVSGSDDRTVQLWDRRSFKIIGKLKGHRYPLSILSFSPDGSLLVSSASAILPPTKTGTQLPESELLFWSVQTRKLVASVDLRGQEVRSIAFAPDKGSLFVLAAAIHEYDLAGKLLNTIALSGTCLAVSPDAKQLAVGKQNGEVHIVDLGSKTTKQTLLSHEQTVTTVRFDLQGDVLSAGADGTINRLSLRNGQVVNLIAHGSGIGDFRLDERHGRIFYTPGNSVFVARLQSPIRDNPVQLSGHEFLNSAFPTISIALDVERGELFTCGQRGSFRVWDVTTPMSPTTNQVFGRSEISRLNDMICLPGTSMLVVVGGSNRGAVQVIDPENCSVTKEHQPHAESITSVDASLDGKWLITGSADRTVKVIETKGFSTVRNLLGHEHEIAGVAISPDTSMIASTGGHDGKLRVWDRVSGALLFEHHRIGYRKDVSFGLGGQVVMVSCFAHDGEWIDVLQTSTGKKMFTIESTHLVDLISHPDASVAAFCTGEHIVLWDVATGEMRTRIPARAPTAAFTRNATRLLYPEGPVVIHHLPANKQMARIPTGSWPEVGPRFIAVDPNGSFFAVASTSGVVQCWRLRKGQ